GDPGSPGRPGQPGPGGIGGPGGQTGHYENNWDRPDRGAGGGGGEVPMPRVWVQDGDGTRGGSGPPGHPRPGGAAASPGVDGLIDDHTGPPLFTGLADVSWLYEILTEAEDDYIAERLSDARESLAFVSSVANDNRDGSRFDALWSRAVTLLAQI